MQSLQERIDSLERTQRRLKLAFAALGFMVITAGCLALAPNNGKPQTVMKAEAFHVVDTNGKTLAVLTSSGGRGELHLKDSSNNILVWLTSSLQNDASYAGSITIQAGAGKVASIGATPTGKGQLRAYNRLGKVLVDAGPASNADAGSIRLANNDLMTITRIDAASDGSGFVEVNNAKGETRVRLSIAGDNGKVQTIDNSGVVTDTMPTTPPN